MGNLVKLYRARDRALQLLLLNKEFLVSMSHQLVLIMFLQGSGRGIAKYGVRKSNIHNSNCVRSMNN
jgi:hypothetical protein